MFRMWIFVFNINQAFFCSALLWLCQETFALYIAKGSQRGYFFGAADLLLGSLAKSLWNLDSFLYWFISSPNNLLKIYLCTKSGLGTLNKSQTRLQDSKMCDKYINGGREKSMEGQETKRRKPPSFIGDGGGGWGSGETSQGEDIWVILKHECKRGEGWEGHSRQRGKHRGKWDMK